MTNDSPATGSSAMPLVSIVCSYYNREQFVDDSVQSLLDQDYPNLEIIIIDDGSPDNTLAKLRHYEGDPRLTLIAQANTGLMTALRRAIDSARGQYIAIFDAGDLCHPQRISKQVQQLIDRPDVGVVGCWVKNDNDHDDGHTLWRPPGDLLFREALLERALFTHGEVMFRRDIYERVGGYRHFFRYSEDRDLWLRMSEHCGYAIVPEVLYHRRKMDDSISLDPEKQLLCAYMADFAVQCATERRAGRPDPVDKFGAIAAFLRAPSEYFARRAAWTAARYLVAGHPDVAWPILARARSESGSRQVRTIAALCRSYGTPLWPSIGRPILARRLQWFRTI